MLNMLSFLNMEFVHALNPLYAFPIVAVILGAFIVYAIGFKSPVQPPSFEGIEDEKKISKKRKTKETNKQGKLIQNGKINGVTVNKPQILPPNKKKEIEKSTSNDKPAAEKQSSNEKKTNKKIKLQNEKKNASEKKKEAVVNEENGEDGWVQLISKKGRKSRKKDEASFTESQPVIAKPIKTSEAVKFDGSSPSEEPPKTINDISLEHSLPEKKLILKEFEEEKGRVGIVSSVESSKGKLTADVKSDKVLEKIPSKESDVKPGKLIEESSNKSKKKKKKNIDIINTDNKAIINIPETPAVPVTSEISSPEATIEDPVTVETSQIIIGKEEDQPKESKTSNVVFDELAGLYPEAKEQRKKKKVRRDH